MKPRASTAARRSLIAECAIGVGLCVALHLFVAQPIRDAFDQKRAEAARLSQQCRETGSLSSRMPDIERALERETEAASEMERRGAPARDESVIFAGIMDLARSSGVQVDTIAPVTTSAMPPSKSASRTPSVRSDREFSFSIRASGSYENISRFLGSLQNRLAYTLISCVRLTPASGPDDTRVHASIETSHFYVDPSTPSVANAGTDGEEHRR